MIPSEDLPENYSVSKAVHDLANSYEHKHEVPTQDDGENATDDSTPAVRRGTRTREPSHDALISIANRPISLEKAMTLKCVTTGLSLSEQKLLAEYLHNPNNFQPQASETKDQFFDLGLGERLMMDRSSLWWLNHQTS